MNSIVLAYLEASLVLGSDDMLELEDSFFHELDFRPLVLRMNRDGLIRSLLGRSESTLFTLIELGNLTILAVS